MAAFIMILSYAVRILTVEFIFVKTTATRLTIYEHYHREGRSFRVNHIDQCLTLPNHWQQIASSVDSHGSCLVLFRNSDCTGKYIRLRPNTLTYVGNLKRVGFNDVISAVKPCQPHLQLTPGRYAIENANDRMYLTAYNLARIGYTAVETQKWRQKISQEWDVSRNRDGTYWLIPRIHFNKNPLTYDMRKYSADNHPEIGMFKEREYWKLEHVKNHSFMIKNDDSRKCLEMEYRGQIEETECDRSSRSQHWIFHQLPN